MKPKIILKGLKCKGQGSLQSTGSQRVRRDWATELNWKDTSLRTEMWSMLVWSIWKVFYDSVFVLWQAIEKISQTFYFWTRRSKTECLLKRWDVSPEKLSVAHSPCPQTKIHWCDRVWNHSSLTSACLMSGAGWVSAVGRPWALWGVEERPWPPLATCQEHPLPQFWKLKMPPDIVICPLRAKSSLVENHIHSR